MLDGDAAGVDSQPNEKGADRHRTIQIERIAVETNGHTVSVPLIRPVSLSVPPTPGSVKAALAGVR